MFPNGVTYYYAVLSYDRGHFAGMDTILNDHGYNWVTGGVDRHLVPIEPSFSPFSFTYNEFDQLTGETVNTAIVTPNTVAVNDSPGHTDATANGYVRQTSGSSSTGAVQVTVVDSWAIPGGHRYQITFSSAVDQNFALHTTSYTVTDVTRDSVIASTIPIPLDSTGNVSQSWFTPVFDGMYLTFYNSKPILDSIEANSGWNSSSKTNLTATIANGGSPTDPVPLDFTIKVTDEPASNPATISGPPQEYLIIIDNSTGDTLNYFFNDNQRDHHINSGDQIFIRLQKPDGSQITAWSLKFAAPAGTSVIIPQTGDQYDFVCGTPFGNNDVYQLNTFADTTTAVKSNALDKVTVVPNPYVVVASWETASALQGRDTQKLYFNHLPAKCTIRIFTQNGYLVKTIQHNGFRLEPGRRESSPLILPSGPAQFCGRRCLR